MPEPTPCSILPAMRTQNAGDQKHSAVATIKQLIAVRKSARDEKLRFR